MGEYDRQRFDEHLDRYLKADKRRHCHRSGTINPSTGLLYGAALTIALGLLGYNVVVNDQISIATMLILLVSLAGLAYPDRRMDAAAESDSSCQSFGSRDLRVPRTAARACTKMWEPISSTPLKEQITFENVSSSRAGRAQAARVALSLEIPAGSRTAIMGQDEDAKLALVCLIPRLLDPRVGPRVDRRP